MPIIDGLLCISKELALVKPSRRKHPQIQTSWKTSRIGTSANNKIHTRWH